MRHSQGLIKYLWHSFAHHIVQPVPEELYFCEFECRFRRCRLGLTGQCEIAQRMTSLKDALLKLEEVPSDRGVQGDDPDKRNL